MANGLRRFVRRLIILNTIFLAMTLVWHYQQAPSGVPLAVAKGGQLFDMVNVGTMALDVTAVRAHALNHPTVQTMLSDKKVDFLNAFALTSSEAQQWSACTDACSHVVFYNYTDGGTIEAIMQGETLIAHWQDSTSRPAGSTHVLPKAVAIAAQDPEVTAMLGDIGAADPAMVPMSGWLMDDDCANQWCVDLTFHDPAGSGKVFHVFVNMEQEIVARTFYTRGRPERTAPKLPNQRNAYTDGCLEQYGWNVCWEMTAHDGLLFRDATYNETPIFSSIKIGQVEAWYPSWPGGYRDEIGFSATVPPFGDTEIIDFGDGFEVRQLFTEFTHWPNCICCYRYIEIIRFNADGSFEPRFVSAGPGCDDLSIYRPFWRIDLNLDDPASDRIWLWQNDQWDEATTEFETHPFVDDVSPDGYKIATIDDDISYRWVMDKTDPLGVDEARFFAVQKKEGQGDGPILAGPGDTFMPPRQWVGDEPLSGGDIVLWFVPDLKTKKTEPFWCMPDPEPEFSPCEAILRAVPAGELRQPTAEEIAQANATATPTPDPNQPTPTIAPTATPRPVQGEDAEEILLNSGCGACHAIGQLGEAGKVGPDLSNIGNIARERVADLSAEAYLQQSILEPNAYIVPDCPNGPCLANIMPQDYGERLTSAQVDMLVTYLLLQKIDEVAEEGIAPTDEARTVIGEENSGATAAPTSKAFPAPKRITQANGGNDISLITMQILLVSMVFLLSLFRLLKERDSFK